MWDVGLCEWSELKGVSQKRKHVLRKDVRMKKMMARVMKFPSSGSIFSEGFFAECELLGLRGGLWKGG